MDQDFIKRNEHVEFAKRMEDEHKRQNKRIDELEEALKQNSTLTVSVEKMAVSMEQMLTEQKRQGTRLEALEARDGEMWRKSIGYVVTTLLGLVIGYLFNLFGGI